MKSETSWENSASWYNDLLEEDKDSYQAKVILPNLLRAMDIKKTDTVLDLACGQGYFTRHFFQAGAKVVGVDIAPSMIEFALRHNSGQANKDSPNRIEYHVSPAHKLKFIKDDSVNIVTIVLGIQNIENMSEVFKEVARVLKRGGRLFLVMNHPAFRILRQSSWGYDEKKKIQYRMVDEYLSESKTSVEMNPGQALDEILSGYKKASTTTVSFHRPLQVYFKVLGKIGFGVTRLEEWISHRTSQKGPRQNAEDKARKEIPLFMMMEAVKLK